MKPAIHYSQTWRIGGQNYFFAKLKYGGRKRDECVAVHCSLFALNFSAADDFFFDEKVLCVRRRDRYPDANPAYGVRQKTCLRNMANTFYRLFAVHRFFVVSPLFRFCLRIVYSGLEQFAKNFFAKCVRQSRRFFDEIKELFLSYFTFLQHVRKNWGLWRISKT